MSTSTSWTGHYRAVVLFALAIAFEVLAIGTVSLRFYSNYLRKRRIAAHDVAIVVALIFVANTPIWGVAISAVKVSMLLLYGYIFRSETIFRYICYACIAFQVSWGISVTLSSLLLCRPLKINWYPTIPGDCGSTKAHYLSMHIINLLLYVIVGLLPVPMLWKLRMKRRKKIEIAIMFGLGTAICIITIFRIDTVNDLVDDDITYTTTSLSVFTILETLLGVILASLPLLRPILDRILGSRSMSRASTPNPRISGQASGSRPDYYSRFSSTSTRAYVQKASKPIDNTTDSAANLTTVENGEGFEFEELGHRRPDNSSILVTNTWNVEMGPSKPSDEERPSQG
ncbi:hypothetical protein BJY04DRAFT_215786 [Aspergillus karnatakaensis]|uniref:uncharacterized protein n=1 Tax=Aspergillus karnatakaensis TaxID=1810916 RepID=UPI003CCDCB2A